VLSAMIRLPFSDIDRISILYSIPGVRNCGGTLSRLVEAESVTSSTWPSSSCSMISSTCSAPGVFHSTTVCLGSTTSPSAGENVGAGGKSCDRITLLAN
jgi:hypothetical protein